MGKKKVEVEQVVETLAVTEPKRPGGKTIARWRQEAESRGGTDQEKAEHVMALARAEGFEYSATPNWIAAKRKAFGSSSKMQRMSPESESRGEPGLAELMKVAALAREHGGIQELQERVKSVMGLAEQVGGLEQLSQCLDALVELGVNNGAGE